MTGKGEQLHIRANRFLAGLAVFFCVLYGRFFYMQVISSSFYRKRSDMNSVRQIPVTAHRGLLFDRNSRVLVENKPSYSLFAVPFEFKRNRYTVDLKALTTLSEAQIQHILDTRRAGQFVPVRIKSNLTFTQLSALEEHRSDLPGFLYHVEPVRSYVSQVRASHVLGYLGEITRKEIEQNGDGLYRPGDIVGKTGVEREYDTVLRGRRGYEYRQVDVRGRETGDFDGTRDTAPVPGRNIMLTLDSGIQEKAEELLHGRAGAVIVMDPNTGGIYGMAGSPDFSLDSFAGGVSSRQWEQLTEHEGRPLLNRPIQAQLPPGSVFKLFLAAAALQTGSVVPETVHTCTGSFILGTKVYACWEEQGHGEVDLRQAIAQSCNVYFYQTGLVTGLGPIADMCRSFGFSQRTGIDLPGEQTGILPDASYLDGKYGKRGWTRGMIANIAVGQGDVLVTPVQLACACSAIAARGRRAVPHLVRAVQHADKRSWERVRPEFSEPAHVSAAHLQVIQQGMYAAVNGPSGTAVLARVPGMEVCGKTGTAQNPRGEPHAWFAGFAPLHNPGVVIVVVLENGGSGGGAAAPIAGALFREFFL